MSRPLVVLRPEPGLSETVAAARAMGVRAIAAPLFAIEPVAWSEPDPAGFDGLLIGSANVFRMGGAGLARLRRLPVHAVGERTAEAARAACFDVAHVGQGGLQRVLDTLEAPARLLRLSGEERVVLSPPAGVGIEEVAVYRAAPLALTTQGADALSAGAVAALHSGEAARRFSDECDRLGVDRPFVAIAALAPRIAQMAGPGWARVEVAERVEEAALLALAARMCQ